MSRCPDDLRDYDCRNNRLAQQAIETDGFADAVGARDRKVRTRAHRCISGHLDLRHPAGGKSLTHCAILNVTRCRTISGYNTTQQMFSVGDFTRRLLGPARRGRGRLHGMLVQRQGYSLSHNVS